jgi:hypothetical protein
MLDIILDTNDINDLRRYMSIVGGDGCGSTRLYKRFNNLIDKSEK